MSEENTTLDDAIRGLLELDEPTELEESGDEEATESTEKEVSTEEGQPDEKVEESEESEAVDEEAVAKLEELESKYGKPEEDDPWLPIQGEEQALLQEQAALQQGFLTGLPDIKNDNNKSIYEMQEHEFDLFLQHLDDDGKERLKVQAIQAREKAVEQAIAFQQRNNSFNERLQQYHQAKLEMEVITDISKQLGLPDVIKKYRDGSITQHLSEKAKADPSIAQKASTKEGLYQLAIMAIRDLKIVQSKGQEDTKKPSAPDAKTASKKVKTKSLEDNSDEALLAKVSKNPSELRKLDPKVRERLMYASIKNLI